MRLGTLVGAAAALVMAAACGAYTFPGSSSAKGTVSGSVMVYPCAPVEQQDQPCNGRPGTGLQLIFTGNSGSQSAAVDANGHYSIELAAGTWKVSVKAIARIVSGPTTITVPGGGSVEADYLVDSGIRVPQPLPAS
jgi:hypothetical protein